MTDDRGRILHEQHRVLRHRVSALFGVPTLIHFLSQDTTLLPGTVLLTGTPEGIGWARGPKVLLHAGDEVTIEIDQIGRLTNPVAAANEA